MLHVQCNGCHTSAYVDCSCPPGWDPVAQGRHVPQVLIEGEGNLACPFGSIDAQVTCPAESGCCKLDHDHAQPCPGGHGACPDPPGKCGTWKGARASVHPDDAGQLPDACPGGHCHIDLEDCTGCRALTITVMPGSTRVQPVSALGA